MRVFLSPFRAFQRDLCQVAFCSVSGLKPAFTWQLRIICYLSTLLRAANSLFVEDFSSFELCHRSTLAEQKLFFWRSRPLCLSPTLSHPHTLTNSLNARRATAGSAIPLHTRTHTHTYKEVRKPWPCVIKCLKLCLRSFISAQHSATCGAIVISRKTRLFYAHTVVVQLPKWLLHYVICKYCPNVLDLPCNRAFLCFFSDSRAPQPKSDFLKSSRLCRGKRIQINKASS